MRDHDDGKVLRAFSMAACTMLSKYASGIEVVLSSSRNFSLQIGDSPIATTCLCLLKMLALTSAQPRLPSLKESLQRQNMTLPRLPKPDSEFGYQILMTERLLSESSADIPQQYGVQRFSAYTETPEIVRAEFIRLDKLSGGSGEVFPHNARQETSGHAFCAIPLELDTFCDYCNQPIWGLGWGPVCQRCADCHMTCHWLCKDKVTISCEVSPPPAHTTIGGANSYVCDDDSNGDLDDDIAAAQMEPKAEGEDLRTLTTSKSSSQHAASTNPCNPFENLREVLRPHQPSTEAIARAVSVGPEIQVTSVLTNANNKHHRTASSPALRPHSQFGFFDSSITILKVDQTSRVGEASKHQRPLLRPPRISASPQGRTIRHQSMLQTRRRHNNRRPSELSRRHTTAVNLASVTVGTYDISSLDRRDIRERGISVWQLSPAVASSLALSATVAANDAPPVVMSSRMQATGLAAVTGHQTGAEEITYTKVTIGPRNAALPWKPMELARRLNIFNTNDFGLCAKMNPKLQPGDCEGQVRVHINLIRPVRMVLTARPPSIFDIVGGDDGDDPSTEEEAFTRAQQPKSARSVRLRSKTIGRITSFRLPRGSSKLLHVHLSTTASQVISSLLDRFNIDDNPQKFALYEHTIFGEHDVSVRKLFEDESPLGLLLQWTLDSSAEGGGKAGEALNREHFNAILTVKRIVLQENETGDIEWSSFSEAELRTFLNILNREEADYRRRIELKYQIRKHEILRLMNLRARCRQRTDTVTASSTTVTNTSSSDCGNNDAKPLAPHTECDSFAPPLPHVPSGDVTRLESTESGECGGGMRDVRSPNRPLCLPDSLPTPACLTPVAASKIISPLRASQTHLPTKVHQKQKVKLKKSKGKKLKAVKESGAKSSKTKSHM
ncbi:Ras association domain-containing protein [Echinococcus granulosus]|uniref:Ras association domain-containing protein n=2 Tax=Echinococcus granulosus TaxID=6210 RepID=W6V217_ECHGR|nr:Ras association domain-containing protein [Echinococcus granulosus]EUB64997.1 Ras association domain-containing protein [Echinococcus granulosus]